MTLTDLIAALEAADGPSRELNKAVLKAVGWFETDKDFPDLPDGTVTEWHAPDGAVWREKLPQPIYSIDAALTLVPEGWRLAEVCRDVEWHDDGRERSFGVSLDHLDASGGFLLDVWGCHDDFAIAICIAALKAREASA